MLIGKNPSPTLHSVALQTLVDSRARHSQVSNKTTFPSLIACVFILHPPVDNASAKRRGGPSSTHSRIAAAPLLAARKVPTVPSTRHALAAACVADDSQRHRFQTAGELARRTRPCNECWWATPPAPVAISGLDSPSISAFVWPLRFVLCSKPGIHTTTATTATCR